jgi:N-methylhydantoinase B
MHSFPFLAPLNHGIIRRLNIISKKGTCVDVKEPNGVSGYCSGAYEKVDHVTMGCWAQANIHVNPRYVHAGSLNLENLCTGGLHPKTGVEFVSYLWLEGGAGACTFRDGTSLINSIYISGASNQPIESWERWYPMVVTRCDIVKDSCGDGRYRGGFGIFRDFTVTGDTVITIHGDREEVTPYGIAEGTNGGPNRLLKNPGTAEEKNLGMFCAAEPLKPGDQILFASNGGGGCGNSLDRPPEAVLEDVLDDYISLEKAREAYGVVIHPVDPEILEYEIDAEATEKLRAEMRQRPPREGYGPGEVNTQGEKIHIDWEKVRNLV